MCSECASDAASPNVALKIVKSEKRYYEAAIDEVALLKDAISGARKSETPCDAMHVVTLLDNFEIVGPHGKHVCMVFEVLGENLLQLLQKTEYRGLPIDLVKNITHQVKMIFFAICRLFGVDFARP